MIIIAKLANFPIESAVFIGGIVFVLPFIVWLGVEIYKKVTDLQE